MTEFEEVEQLKALQKRMKDGERLFEDDLPESLQTLNDVMQKYSPEYVVKFKLMEFRLEQLGEDMTTFWN